tara:strand:- start:21858 stop:23222 length:1365 start_codon:yes stop_codon:yes gene_type:complete
MDNQINSKKLVDRLKQLSTKNSINKWDIGSSSSSDSNVQVDNGEPKQLKSSQRSVLTIRVWNDEGLVGTTSTSDITDSGLQRALMGAKEASNYGNINEIPEFSSMAKENIKEFNKPFYEMIGITKLLDKLLKAESKLLNSNDHIKSIPYNGLSETIFERTYANSDGAFRYQKGSQSSIYLYARAEQTGRKPRSSGSVKVGYGSDLLDIEGCINEAKKLTLSHLNYRPINTGKYLVCFTPKAFLELLGSFSNIFNARSIIDGLSLSNKNSIGTTISVNNLNIFDNGLHSENIGATPFDGEGTPTQNICLLKNGNINSFIHSELTARKFGAKPTGHAGLASKASVGLDWLIIENSDYTKCKQCSLNKDNYKDQFVLIESLSALHAGVKPSQGSFSLPFDGWLINEGEKVSVESATIAGDIRDILINIVKIESIQEITPQGICPHIWISDISITGGQ